MTVRPSVRRSVGKCWRHLLVLPGLPVSKGSPVRNEGVAGLL